MIAQKDNRRLRTQDHDDAADLIHEFRRVYADALVPEMSPRQRVRASQRRQLVWLHSQRVSLQLAARLYGQLATYNGFRPGMVEALWKAFAGQGITVTPAREYSVALYIHLPRRPTLRKRVEGFVRDNLDPDELSWDENETLRLWWD